MDYPKPSVFTPFLRRFTNERQREFDETRQLYDWVKYHQDRFTETKLAIGKRIYRNFEEFPSVVSTALAEAMYDLISAEWYIWELPPPAIERFNMQEFVEYRNLLYAKQYFFMNQEKVLQTLDETLRRVLYWIAVELPEIEDPSPFTVPLIYALPEPRLLVNKTYHWMIDDALTDMGMFRGVAARLIHNIYAASGREVGDSSKKPIKHAGDSTLSLDEVAKTYLQGTPFYGVFMTPVPLKLTHDDRMNHMHVVGGSGSGKTTLIENLLLHDISSGDSPSLVVIDPHSDLIRKLTRADLGIKDRLILIDPRDTQHFPALNIFALNEERMEQYDETTREQVTAGAIQTLEYLFAGFGIDLTGKQQVLFRNVCRLMLSFPDSMGRNATIIDMLKLMSDPAPYGDAIGRLPDIPRDFFKNDFTSKNFAQTREQVRYRLQALLDNPTLARLFTSPETKVDLFDELNNGSIILVDTAKDFLKDGSAVFGRLFISLVLQAVLERGAIPADERKDTFLVVDEAASVFDTNIDDLLTDARKYRCGCLFAHQYLQQGTPALQASLAANTSIKFASGLSAQDARRMASEMRTTPEFILNQPRLQFAAHIRNVTPQAVSIPVTPGVLDRLPKLSDHAYAALIDSNRRRVSLSGVNRPATSTPWTSPHPSPSGPPDEDISEKW